MAALAMAGVMPLVALGGVFFATRAAASPIPKLARQPE